MDPDDICLWPNGDYCTRDELEDYGRNKSDDFEIIPYGSRRWKEFCCPE